jgi:HK97 family phage portal protein
MRGIFGQIVNGMNRDKGSISDSLVWSKMLGEDGKSKAGVAVNVDSALRVSTVLACTRVLAEGVAQLPLRLYRQDAKAGKQLADDLPLYKVLARKPNGWMTSFELREALMWHAVLGGNGLAVKVIVNGETRELLPVAPGCTTIRRLPDWSLLYDIRDQDGPIGTFTQAQVFHLRGPSWNTFRGLDIIQLARDAIGLAIATEENHSRLFSNGARPGGILSTSTSLTDEAIKRLRTGWEKAQSGLDRAYKTAVLDSGITWTPMGMTGVDAQALEARRYQVEEVCRFMRVFPQMVASSDKTSTYASAEQFFLAHVVHSLGPWIERFEQTAYRDLIDGQVDQSKGEVTVKLIVQGLLRGDAKTRADFYTKLYGIGVLNPNEIRELEERNPYEGGDAYRVPLNMVEPAKADEVEAEPKEPA